MLFPERIVYETLLVLVDLLSMTDFFLLVILEIRLPVGYLIRIRQRLSLIPIAIHQLDLFKGEVSTRRTLLID